MENKLVNNPTTISTNTESGVNSPVHVTSRTREVVSEVYVKVTGKGWFSLHRKIFDCEDFSDEPYTEMQAWIWMIGYACYEDKKIVFNKVVWELKRGQFVSSIRILGKGFKWGMSKTRHFIDKLIKLGKITTQETTNRGTLVTICNYNTYQDRGRTEQQTDDTTHDEPTTNPPHTTNNIINNNNNINKKEKRVSLIDKWIRENDYINRTYRFYLDAIDKSETQYQLTSKRKQKIERALRDLYKIHKDWDKVRELMANAIYGCVLNPWNIQNNVMDLADNIFRSYEQMEKRLADYNDHVRNGKWK